MRFRFLLAAAAVLCAGVSAHADDFTFTLNGSAGGFYGTGTFTGEPIPGVSGYYSITGVSGSNTNGVIGSGMFGGNDNLLTPNASNFVDGNGIGFYDQTAVGVYAVRLYQATNGVCPDNSSSQYCVDVQEVNTAAPTDPTTTLPVTFPGTTGTPARVAVRFTLNRVNATTPVAATPEPGSLMLLGSGALALAGFGRRRFLQS